MILTAIGFPLGYIFGMAFFVFLNEIDDTLGTKK